MPRRTTVFTNGEMYHIFNRTTDHKQVFVLKKLCERALETVEYYRFHKPPVKFSFYRSLPPAAQQQIRSRMNSPQVTILCHCLMANHYHFILRQEMESGIQAFVTQFQNSFTKYFNTRSNRTGHLFAGQFKAIRIETEEHLMHLSRYVHLNPHTGHVVKDIPSLLVYPWSSLPAYLGSHQSWCDSRPIMEFMKSKESYEQFLLDQADYQRTLHVLKHICMEEEP